MASHGDDSHGATDISEHVRTWKGFTGLIKWSTLVIAIVMLALLLFRTHG
jgi:Bacterial aa3 type cytochrome c oxidase subunit IV